MDLGLCGKIALVTGASKGIGKAIAAALAAEQATVYICARNRRDLLQTAREIGEVGVLEADVTRDRDVARMIRSIRRVDILVNNAGGLEEFGGFTATSLEQWRASYEWNVLSAVRITQAALPKIPPGGTILNIASELGKQPAGFAPHYGAAKAALLSLTRFLAEELAPRNIRVNALCPGPVITDSWTREAQEIARRDRMNIHNVLRTLAKSASKRTLLGRVGQVEDVAPLAAFLVSPRAKWITGAAFSVDGGAVRAIE